MTLNEKKASMNADVPLTQVTYSGGSCHSENQASVPFRPPRYFTGPSKFHPSWSVNLIATSVDQVLKFDVHRKASLDIRNRYSTRVFSFRQGL